MDENKPNRLERDSDYEIIDRLVTRFMDTNDAELVADYLEENPATIHEFSQMLIERWGPQNINAAAIGLGDVIAELVERNNKLRNDVVDE